MAAENDNQEILEKLLSHKGVEIGNNCFYQCNKLTKITIPSSVTSIGKNAFLGCKSLSKIEIPSSIKYIGNGAFAGCESLTELSIPPSDVTSDGDAIIFECNKLKRIKVPASLLSFSVDEYRNFINGEEYDVEELSSENSINKIYKMRNKKTGEQLVAKKYPTYLFNYKKSNFDIRCEIFNSGIKELMPVLKVRYSLFDREYSNPELQEIEVIDEKGNTIMKDYPSFTIITKYLEYGNLEELTNEYLESEGKNHDKMNPTIRSKIIFGVAAMMREVHEKTRDFHCITMNNILLNENFEPRVSFHPGFHNKMELLKKHDEFSKDLLFYIDKIILKGYCQYKPDVYSFGFFVYRMFSCSFKFDDSCDEYLDRDSCQDRPVRPDNIPDNYWDLIQDCWNEKRGSRQTFHAITELLYYDDQFALEEFGMETDMEDFENYKKEALNLSEDQYLFL